MTDDRLKRMLADAQAQKANLDAKAKSDKEKLLEDTASAGKVLRDKVMPRLQEAQKAWEGEAKLSITDKSDQFDVSTTGRRSHPMITVGVSAGRGYSSYSFQSHYTGYVSILEGAGGNEGNNAYQFKVEKIDDLTNDKIDEILEVMVKEAFGLSKRR